MGRQRKFLRTATLLLTLVAGATIGFVVGNEVAGLASVRPSENEAASECTTAMRIAREQIALHDEALDITRRYPTLTREAVNGIRTSDLAAVEAAIQELHEADADLLDAYGALDIQVFKKKAQACEDALAERP